MYQFAAAAPYSYSRLQKYLAVWEKRAQAFATRESIAQTTVRLFTKNRPCLKAMVVKKLKEKDIIQFKAEA